MHRKTRWELDIIFFKIKCGCFYFRTITSRKTDSSDFICFDMRLAFVNMKKHCDLSWTVVKPTIKETTHLVSLDSRVFTILMFFVQNYTRKRGLLILVRIEFLSWDFNVWGTTFRCFRCLLLVTVLGRAHVDNKLITCADKSETKWNTQIVFHFFRDVTTTIGLVA